MRRKSEQCEIEDEETVLLLSFILKDVAILGHFCCKFCMPVIDRMPNNLNLYDFTLVNSTIFFRLTIGQESTSYPISSEENLVLNLGKKDVNILLYNFLNNMFISKLVSYGLLSHKICCTCKDFTCTATTDNTSTDILLNSSKQPHAPVCAKPL